MGFGRHEGDCVHDFRCGGEPRVAMGREWRPSRICQRQRGHRRCIWNQPRRVRRVGGVDPVQQRLTSHRRLHQIGAMDAEQHGCYRRRTGVFSTRWIWVGCYERESGRFSSCWLRFSGSRPIRARLRGQVGSGWPPNTGRASRNNQLVGVRSRWIRESCCWRMPDR